ncbi:MAG: hypothetical protein ACR2IA_01625 [Pyrinomonadaceae bacterium]
MARFIRRIPEDYQSGLARVVSLSNNDINELLTIFENTPVILNGKKFNQELLPKITFLESVEARNLIETIGSLYELRNQLDLTTEEFVDEITDVMKESQNKKLKLTESNYKKFKQRLTDLLAIKTLALRSKAVNLIVDHSVIFQDAKIVSDIRPIFGLNIEESPIGSVIIHNLKIEYKQNDEIKNFYIALDEKDITTLLGLLKRTQTKSESLKSFIANSGLSNFDVE